jgi:hypothetical protein
MRYIRLISLTLFALTLTACSYSTDFIVVNESAHPIDVRYKIKRFPNEPPELTVKPIKMDASQLGKRDRQQRKELSADQYQIDQENHTITVSIKPREALLVTSMFHYIGDEDPNDVANWPIEEITVTGDIGEMTFTGQQARKSFSYVSRVLYTLTYK